MRRILLSCACAAMLLLPAGASARAAGHAKPGYLVVRRAVSDGGVNGPPVATVVVQGFVLGRFSQEARVDVFQLPTAAGQGAPQVAGADVSKHAVRWHGFTGTEYRASGFRFRAMGGFYRVVVRGAGVYLFAGGKGNVTLQGSSVNRRTDGVYALNGGAFRSLPTTPLARPLRG
jgi:Ca2+-binding RTX toxin-like protein